MASEAIIEATSATATVASKNLGQTPSADFNPSGSLADAMILDTDGKSSIALCVKAGKPKAECERLRRLLNHQPVSTQYYVALTILGLFFSVIFGCIFFAFQGVVYQEP